MLNGLREPDRDYYNDLPGKVPPDIGPPPVPPLPACSTTLPNLKYHGNSNAISSNSNNHSNNIPESSTKSQKPNPQWTGKKHLNYQFKHSRREILSKI